MAMFLNGVGTIGMTTIKARLRTEVLGQLTMRRQDAYGAAVPGTPFLGIAGLPIATAIRPTTATTLLVFELYVVPRGLFKRKPITLFPVSLFPSMAR